MPKKKHKFRKIYVVCTNNIVIEEKTWTKHFWQERKRAELYLRQEQKQFGLYVVKDGVEKHAVHGFYLVHESLFDEILKEYSKEG